MAEEDKEKTAFYTDQGTYCYTKMLFRMKNAGATYQRLGDSTFQSQIGRNLKAYVDNMVIKSKDEKMLLADIAETFDNLKKINMKLNPKKCSFRVKEGNFLGYMVTSEGFRANPKKTKDLADLQSPRTLKEMQSLSEKLASLNRFFAKSAERSLPFFNTLKNIIKENKREYRWMEEAEEAFQQIKKLILDHPSLTSPWPKETLYAYLTVSAEAVSAVLLTDRKGRQCLMQYVSRTLNEAERNYAPMEKLALSLIHMTRRLRRYFEAHPVKLIIDQPIKHILNKTESFVKLAKYTVELGAYNIMFVPRNAVKGQVLADFLSEAPKGEKEELYFWMPEVPIEKDDVESWTLFTDGASKGQEVHTVVEEEWNNWMIPIIRCLEERTWLNDKMKHDVYEPRLVSTQWNRGSQATGKDHWQRDEHNSGSPPSKRHGRKGQQEFDGGYQTLIERERASWVDELPDVLWAHQTSIKQSNGEKPFSLTYGSEAVIPAEIGIPTYQTLMIREEYNEDEMRLNLDLLQERRETTAIREARYKTKMEQYYNKKVRPSGFRTQEFVFRRNKASMVEDQGKLGPKWEGPYRVVKAYDNGSYKLLTLEDKEVPRTWHAINLRKCYM
uniref:Reverse transcriptase domain-containing protein n=1 Tax=Tanacetum cinerariifolium TaxID=118510 RepID=A0A699JBC6_TANCI|nr:reverse transcriptase domain-containing protein [Tanacetum cinerariifolium]